MDSWDYVDYLLKASVEFRTMNGHFTKFYRNRGVRIGKKPAIAKLDLVSSMFARLEWPDEDNQIQGIIVGNFAQPWKALNISLFSDKLLRIDLLLIPPILMHRKGISRYLYLILLIYKNRSNNSKSAAIL